MIFFIIAWGLLVLFLFFQIRKHSAALHVSQRIAQLQQLLIVGMLLYSITGVITNDPLITDVICKKWDFCVPKTYEWVVYLGILGFVIWRFVLLDMKKDMGGMKIDIRRLDHKTVAIEKRVIRIEATLEHVKDTLNLLLKKAKLRFD